MSRSRILAFAAALALAACSKPDLAHRYQAKVLAAAPGATVEIVDASTLRVKLPGGDVANDVSLDNLRDLCRDGEDVCESAMDRAVRSLVTYRPDAPVDPSRVRVLLKPADFAAQVEKIVASSPPDKRADNALFLAPFGGDVITVLVEDLPDGMAMLNHGEAKRLGKTEAELRALARVNMAKALAPLPIAVTAPGVLLVHAGDDYEAARLLVPQIWDDAAKQVKGDLLAVAPNRDVVFATGEGDAAGVARMKELAAASFARHAYPLSLTVFRRTSAGFVPAT